MVVRAPELPQLLPPFRRVDLPGLGLSRHELDALLRAGAVLEPIRGAYIDARSADHLLTRAAAAALVLPADAALSRRTAAWLYGVDPRAPSERHLPIPLEGVVRAVRVVPHRAGVVVREANLPDDDVCVVHGVPVTSPDRTALDLTRFLAPHMGLAVLDAMAGRGLVDPSILAPRVEEWAGERYIGRARRLVQWCEPAAESFGESWLRLRIMEAGFPRPTVQILVREVDGRVRYRLDLGWIERMLATEYDGEEFHTDPADRAADVARRLDLRRNFGWTAIGVGRAEVLGRSTALELALGELLGMTPTLRCRTW